MPEEIRLPIRNVELAAQHWPAKSMSRVLALHGWLDNAQSFGPLAEKMTNHEIVALDLPGHGHSGHRPQGEILHYIDYIADVFAVLKTLKWDSCVLMGHSMGAGIASLFACAFPEKLRGLICIDGLGPVSAQMHELVPRLAKSVRSIIEPEAQSKTVYESVEQAVQARARAGSMSKSSAKRLVDRNLMEIKNGYVWRSDARLRLPSLYYLSEQQVQSYLSKITVPTFMVRPTESAYRADRILMSRASLIGNLTWINIPGGHHAHMDQVDQILEPLNYFIDNL